MGPNADREMNKLMIFYLLENFLATKMTKIVSLFLRKSPEVLNYNPHIRIEILMFSLIILY